MTQPLEGDFNPSVHFLGLLKKAVGDGVARRCAVAGGPQVVVAPRQMAYYSASATAEDLRRLCLAEPFDLQIEALPNWNPDAQKETIQVGRMRIRAQADAAAAGLSPRPLAGLLWLASLSVSRGRLMQGCRADDPVRLKRLPDFSALPHRESHVRLAQAMHEVGGDLPSLARRTGLPLGEVYDFFNACAVLGLVERGNVFEPSGYFLGLLQLAQRDGLARRCDLPGLPPLFLAPKERRYYSQAADLASVQPYCAASLDEMRVETVERIDAGGEEEETIQIGRMLLRRKKEQQAPRLAHGALEELLWSAALQCSRGRLLAGKNAEDVVRLRRWPDFSRLSRDRRLLPVAAFMSVNAASLPAVARHTGAPLAQVVDFHNACAVLDYLEYLPEERLHSRPARDKERDTYRAISRSLGGMRAARHAG